MGLNLLEVIQLQLPSIDLDVRQVSAPPLLQVGCTGVHTLCKLHRAPSLTSFSRLFLELGSCVQAYLAGLTFALVASPCSTPVLATLLAYVSATQDPLLGGALLITYTTGCVFNPNCYNMCQLYPGHSHLCLLQVCQPAACCGHFCRCLEAGHGVAAVEWVGHTRFRRIATGWRDIRSAISSCSSIDSFSTRLRSTSTQIGHQAFVPQLACSVFNA